MSLRTNRASISFLLNPISSDLSIDSTDRDIRNEINVPRATLRGVCKDKMSKFLGLPLSFRFRVVRRHLTLHCSIDHVQYMTFREPHCKIVRLRRNHTLQEYATCCALLVFHWTVSYGNAPTFWTAEVLRRVHDVGEMDIVSRYSAETGILAYRLRMEGHSVSDSIQAAVNHVSSRIVN